jgi:hypothetical protein
VSEFRTVVIPACPQHEGVMRLQVALPWRCIHCGAPRGEPRPAVSYDGSLRLDCDGWENPCGHVEKYSEVRAWIDREVRK